MEKLTLNSKKRDLVGRKVKNLRSKGIVPGVLYGKKFENVNFEVNENEFEKVLEKAGTSTLVNLLIDDRDLGKILIHEPQRDPVSGKILSVDLYKVDMLQEIKTEIPLNFIGSSLAVDELEGNLITNKDAIEIECLPDNLVSEIDVDISALKTFEDIIKVSDLKIPSNIKVLAESDEIIAQVTPPRSEEELEEMEQEASKDAEKAQIDNIESEAEKEKAEKDAEKEEVGADTEVPKEEEKESSKKE